MKKLICSLSLLFCMQAILFAQAYEEKIQYNKQKQEAIVIDYAYPAAAVENAFISRMEKLGYKAREEKGILNRDKGFFVFKNAYVDEITKDKYDYIIKVERKSRKETDESTLYLILQKDGGNVVGKLDSYDLGNAKRYVNNLLPDIEAANLELEILAQEEVVTKGEKKLKSLKEEKEDLEKRISENEKSQDDAIKDIENQRKALEALREKRKVE